jgi:hypothetical protein
MVYINFEQSSITLQADSVDGNTIANFTVMIFSLTIFSWNPSSDSRKNTHSYRLPYGYGKYLTLVL